MKSVYDLLSSSIPNDNSVQSSGMKIVRDQVDAGFLPNDILDLGCGIGSSFEPFQSLLPKATWSGVDIESSPEVNARKISGKQFFTYNGTDLPFDDNSFDLIYSHQVFEHIRYPEKVLSEIKRVLRPNGKFIGQTSHLEPYHSYSIFNFTPYGWYLICLDAGLKLSELRPGIDGITLIKRSYLGREPSYNKWFSEESPLNSEIRKTATEKGLSHRLINFRQLMYSGQFAFLCEH